MYSGPSEGRLLRGTERVAHGAGGVTMLTDEWTMRAAGPLVFHYHEGSFAHENIDAIVERYEKALVDVRATLDVGGLPGAKITVYLCEVLDDEPVGQQATSNTRLDFDSATIWTVVTSLSAGAYPEFELTRLVLRLAHGPSVPEARFWEDGLAGYLAGRGGASYYAEAPARAQKMREEGQLRPLLAITRNYHQHWSPASTTVAVALATYLIEWRGLERYRRFLLAARTGSPDPLRKEYGRPLPDLDQLWLRQMESTARAGGGKTLAAIKGAAPHFRPYRWKLAAIFVTILLGLSFDLFMPQAIRFLIDNILNRRPLTFTIPFVAPAGYRIEPGGEAEWLFGLLGMMVFMFLLNAVARLRQAAMTARVSQSVVFDLRMRFLDHLQRLPLAFHSRTPANDVVQRFQTDIAYVAAAFSAGVAPMVSNGIAMLLFGAMLISLNPMLSIIALAGLPIFAFSYRTGRATMRQNQRETVRRNQEIQQAVIENMNAQPLLKSWGQRASVMERFREKLELNREINVRNAMITQAFNRASVLITNGAQVAVLIAGGLVVIWSNGEDLTAGGLTAFYVLLLRLYGPAGLFAGAFQTLSLSADGLERVNKVLERTPEQDAEGARPAGPLRASIRFEGTSYAPTRGKDLIKDVTLDIRAGSKVAFVGPTGAGKATLMQVLPGLNEITEGRITWDGADMNELTRDSLRSQVVVLPQDTFIFNMTLYENILIGRPTATEAEVTTAAKTVGLHDWVCTLPGGYDTIVSDRDTAVSTPYRQRIAAARALLRTDASVVLMEDALAAVDAAEQREIEVALRGPGRSRTLIRIAQRLGTITDADQIFVMDGGEVVERGTHDELLDRGGLYVQLITDELGEAAVTGARQAVRRLSKLAPFSSLPPAVLEETARLLLYAERGPGEIILRQGSVGDELYIIGRGDVEILAADDDGHETIVAVLGEGDYVGEISFIRRTPRTATVRAVGNVELHILRRFDFDALLERLGAGTLSHLEETAQVRIEDTRQKLAALAVGQ